MTFIEPIFQPFGLIFMTTISDFRASDNDPLPKGY
jgi:hypothetical protein